MHCITAEQSVNVRVCVRACTCVFEPIGSGRMKLFRVETKTLYSHPDRRGRERRGDKVPERERDGEQEGERDIYKEREGERDIKM